MMKILARLSNLKREKAQNTKIIKCNPNLGPVDVSTGNVQASIRQGSLNSYRKEHWQSEGQPVAILQQLVWETKAGIDVETVTEAPTQTQPKEENSQNQFTTSEPDKPQRRHNADTSGSMKFL